ncbi:hypothetical protein C9374_013938 [Naegleria lovaniensis]|uniref:BTB domain-containing protein n=1 Tax=Naegleria lovaniensis TaxID=51637 RepID=A0AA88KPE9_NAELO|nr:uncharacterized protein C9374_013938 [Naegleria lovaniensis]KAG2389378.1 hypothetical protein C9374_013938 [Naegleria lovaniensis]
MNITYDQETEMFICGGTGVEFTSTISANQPLTKTSLWDLYFASSGTQSNRTSTPVTQQQQTPTTNEFNTTTTSTTTNYSTTSNSSPVVSDQTTSSSPSSPNTSKISKPSRLESPKVSPPPPLPGSNALQTNKSHPFSQASRNIVFVPTPFSEGVVFHNYKEIFLCGHILKEAVQTLHKIPVYSETDNSISQLVACRHSLFVLLSNGKLYAVRGNEMVLYFANDKRNQQSSETATKSLLKELYFEKTIKWVSNGGGKHFFLLTTDNELYAVGDDTFGQIGCTQIGLGNASIKTGNLNAPINSKSPGFEDRKESRATNLEEYESTTFYPKFVKVPIDKAVSIQDYEIEKVECGLNHTFVLLKHINTCKKLLLSTGCSYYGQTAVGSTRNRNRLTPVEFDHCDDIIDIKCNNNGSFIMTHKALYYAGINDQNILSMNKAYCSVFSEVPLMTHLASNDQFSMIDCGYNHCIVVTKRNRIFGFGRSSSNQFGIGLNNYICQEIECKDLFDKEIVGICCGHSHTILFTQPLRSIVEDDEQLVDDLIKLRSSNHLWDVQVFTAAKDYSVKIPHYFLAKRRPELLHYDKSKAPKSRESLNCLVDWIYFNNFSSVTTNIETLIDLLEWMTTNNVIDEYLSTMVLNEAIIQTNEENVYDTIQYILNNKYPKDEFPLYSYWHHALSFCKQFIVENTFNKIKNSSYLKQNILVEIAKLSNPTLLKTKSLGELDPPSTIPEIVAELFDDEESSDLQVVLDRSRGFIIYCHKSILECRCSFFSMKKYGFQAATIKEMDFSQVFSGWKSPEEITYDDFLLCRSLIHFFYTGKICITTKNALSLMLIWEAMKMPEQAKLFEVCMDFVARGLSVDNIMEVIAAVINRPNYNTFSNQQGHDFGSFTHFFSKPQEVSIRYDYTYLQKECLNFCANKWKDILLRYRNQILKYLTKEQLLEITCLQNRVSFPGTSLYHHSALPSVLAISVVQQHSLQQEQFLLNEYINNNTQKRFGPKHLYIRGKLHYQKKLQQEKKVSKLSEKAQAAYRSTVERSQNFAWKPTTATEELYQKNILELKNTKKRVSAKQFIEMLSTVQSASDFNYTMRYWRTLCLRRIKFTPASTHAILEAMEKYDENHPQTSIELIKNSGPTKLGQPLDKKTLLEFISKLVNDHNDVENALMLFNELKLGHLNLTASSEDFEFIFELIKDKDVSKEKIIELFDKQPIGEGISCSPSVLTSVYGAFNEVGDSLDVAIKRRVIRYLRDQSLGKDDSIYEDTKQKLSDLVNASTTTAEGAKEE